MLDDILDSFSLEQPVSVRQIDVGLVNQTFQVLNGDGIYALQSLHPVFPDEALQDMQVVTTYLSQQGFRVPKLLPTKNGEFFMRDHNNLRWRLYSWIDGRVHENVQTPAMAAEAGLMVGKLHRALINCPYRLQGSIPHFHDTPYILQNLEKVFNQLPEEAQSLARNVLEQTPTAIIDERNLSAHIIHGDLKISNLVFDDNQQAIGIIDFDTLLHRPGAIDMGDALRSWCNRTREDDPVAQFDNDIFAVAEQGYQTGFGENLDTRALHRQATRQIALELSARFLTDMVTDNYFGFDADRYPSRQAHNFARAKGQYHLATTI